tara:strand:+ start:3695 stop:3961 length:267 start_codon:yes stop_codon:yes gene_type:complete
MEQARKDLKKALEQSLLDFMGVEIQTDGKPMYYTMDMETILEPLEVFVYGLLTLNPNEKTNFRLKPDGEPFVLQVPPKIQNIIKTLRK